MYMRGDYYAGDYYAGDPGLFSGIAKFATGLLSKTPIGMAVSSGVGLIRSAAKKPQIQATGANPAAQAQVAFERTTIGGGLIYSKTTAGATMMSGGGGGGGMGPGTAVQCVPGMSVRRTHLNKSTYVTRGGGTSRWPQELQVHYKGTECVPSRRMNVANPRALRRALRRVAGFGKLAKRSRRAVSIAASSLGVRGRSGSRKVRR